MITQSFPSVIADATDYPWVNHRSIITIMKPADSEGVLSDSIGAAVSFDLSRGGMRIFAMLPITEPEVAVLFTTPKRQRFTRNAHVVRTLLGDESTCEYYLEFESPLPESSL